MNYEFKLLKAFKQNDGRVGVTFFYNNKRYRYFNAKAIHQVFNPNTCDLSERQQQLDEMLNAFTTMLKKGWRPTTKLKEVKVKKEAPVSLLEVCSISIKQKLNNDFSDYYLRDLNTASLKFFEFLKSHNYEQLKISEFDATMARELLNYVSNSKRVQFNYRRTYSALLSAAFKDSKCLNPFMEVKVVKQVEVLHKPIKNIKLVLDELLAYNAHLHLCCLLAYGCLLRPHREIRNLKWGDFNDDLSQISLSGSRNKSKRNRIVPIPKFIHQYLKRGDDDCNIFTGQTYAYNPDYFKTIWTRYKKSTLLLNLDNTLYSFRHTGAINVYERTGNLNTLQQVMGHSNLQISLTYLRGLEVNQLTEEDMPDLK